MPASTVAGSSFADGRRAVQSAPPPGVQRRPGREDHLPLHRVVRIALAEFRARGGTQGGDRTEQMVGEACDVVLAARRLLGQVVGGDAAHHLLQDDERFSARRVRRWAASRVRDASQGPCLLRYDARPPIVAQMKTRMRVAATALIAAGVLAGCSNTTTGTVAQTTEPGPPLSTATAAPDATHGHAQHPRNARHPGPARLPDPGPAGLDAGARGARPAERHDHDLLGVPGPRRGHPARGDQGDPRRAGDRRASTSRGSRRSWPTRCARSCRTPRCATP